MNVAINTYVDNATRIYEDFRLETLRVQSDGVSPWDSTMSILSYDNNLGLQYLHSRLVYPSIDFRTYNPYPLSQPNYNGSTGDRMFIRRFWHTTNTFSNGRMVFGTNNLTEALLASGDITIFISPNNSTWFDLSQPYMGGVIPANGGCRINADTNGLSGATVNNNSLEFTFGAGLFSSEVWFRITYKDSVSGHLLYMDSMNLINWA
jgi:hypothetical protein